MTRPFSARARAGHGRRDRLCRLVATSVLAAGLGLPALAGADQAEATVVRDAEGVYRVTAAFTLPANMATVFATLTDYAAIPRYVPEIRVSQVLEHGSGRAVVAQESVARFLMFSRRLHLLLDVHEAPDAIRFVDRSGRSFSLYEGAWLMSQAGTGTKVGYELAARPTFAVPEFLLRKLMSRDATVMIGRMKAEIATRSRTPGH